MIGTFAYNLRISLRSNFSCNAHDDLYFQTSVTIVAPLSNKISFHISAGVPTLYRDFTSMMYDRACNCVSGNVTPLIFGVLLHQQSRIIAEKELQRSWLWHGVRVDLKKHVLGLRCLIACGAILIICSTRAFLLSRISILNTLNH